MRSADWPLHSPARSIRVSILAALVATLGLLSPWSSNPSAQAGSIGQWQILTGAQNEVPINPIHVGLMTDGRVLLVAGSGNDPNETNWQATVWDPLTRTFATQPTPFDMFCNGMVNLPDGRMFINGGNLLYDPFRGEKRTAVYDPKTEVFTDVEDMVHGRWYPTPVVLGDGRIMTFSGLREDGPTNSTVEIYTVGSGWSPEYSAGWTPPLYPRLHLLPNGNVFYSGSGRNSRIFNTTTNTWSGTIATTVFPSARPYGTSVLLPLSPTDNYRARVMIFGGANPGTPTTEVIEPLAQSPAWSSSTSVTTQMSQGRIQLNATILPSGRILVTGGSSQDENENTASLNADLFNPDATPISRSPAGQNALPRVYHSNALLLPDATVMLTGGNPERGDYESQIEIYSPAYLFNSNGTPATRPIITDGPSNAVDYGATFEIETPNAGSIASVVAIRPGTPSHAFDFEQRLVRLSYTAGSGVLNVVAPPHGNIAPPGYYMVFILNSAGVPSTARFVQFLASGGGGTTTLTAAPATVTAGQLVTATWSNIINPAPMDWIGIHTPGAADASFLSWAYVNCLQTPGAAAASGSCALPGTSSLSPGTYQFRLFRNDGFVKLATSNNFAVSAPSGSATVTVTPPSVPAGGSVTVGWSGITGPAAMDWFGLYSLGAPNGSFVTWRYVNCTQTPTGPIPSGQCSLPLAATLAPGQYEIRLFRNDGFTLLGVSPAFTVTLPSPPTLTASPSTVVRGTSVTATWSGITGASPTDWIGVHTASGADTAIINWRYVNCSQTPGGPVPSGSCAIPVPASAVPGTYQLRLFRNDGFVKMATSNNFTVTQ
jgi:Domain of unknown function (DUF1929)